MSKRSNRYQKGAETLDPAELYSIEAAFGLMKEMPAAKFDESVELAINLGVDPKHADQMVRGAVVLPHGTGGSVRVLVFAKGEKERKPWRLGRTTSAPTNSRRRSRRMAGWSSTA